MKSRRGSLWGAGMEEMVMQFQPGDIVKPVVVNNLGFSGVVRDVDPKINKVMVSWGNGRATQHDPDEIQLVPTQDATVKARMASGRRVKKADADFFADRVSGKECLGTRRGRSATDIVDIVESEERMSPGDETQTDFLSPEMEQKLNEQVGVEFYSAYLYFIVAAWFQSKGLVGFQAWMERQGNDEIEHGMKVFKYLMDTGSQVDLPAIPAPKVDFSSAAEATRAVLDHEMLVTRLWKEIGEVAKTEPNLATQELAQWFMTEQVEEEDGALTLHQKVQMADTGTGVLVLDNDLKERDPNEVTASARTAGKRETVKVDWNDEKSIKNAERKKSKLENQGYSLVKTTGGLTTSELVYEMKASEKTARVHFKPGDKLVVKPVAPGLKKSYPASKLTEQTTVKVMDEGASEGLDVYDVETEDGKEDSIYGFQVVKKASASMEFSEDEGPRVASRRGRI